MLRFFYIGCLTAYPLYAITNLDSYRLKPEQTVEVRRKYREEMLTQGTLPPETTGRSKNGRERPSR